MNGDAVTEISAKDCQKFAGFEDVSLTVENLIHIQPEVDRGEVIE